ncbi:MAG TPA: class I SAM-dependent methyltransferase [Roseimicrobium sp.]|nr:class I SAM-dependent methyltransferase [Roseimicrobium sp.]
MSTPLDQHQVEIERNRLAWEQKPLLRELYNGFYRRILYLVDGGLPGRVVEIGSGIGNLKSHLPEAVSTDLFPNPWLDLVCDGYELPFRDGTVSHLVLFDVFHHLEAPAAFLTEAKRVLVPGGRVIIFDPCISAASYPVYGLLHHEPVAMGKPISTATELKRPRAYYAAQGNATRVFFRGEAGKTMEGWNVFHREAFSSFAYLLSGGYSKPAVYPAGLRGNVEAIDRFLSRWPRAFAGRCLVGLTPVR